MDSDENFKERNEVNQNRMEDLQQSTNEITQYLIQHRYTVKRFRECEWYNMIKKPEVTAFIKTLKTVEPRRKLNFDKILKGVYSGELFGFLLCDIHTPEELKSYFKDLPPIFKNSLVSRDDIGNHMKEFALQAGVLKKPRKMLISSYFGERILLIPRWRSGIWNMG